MSVQTTADDIKDSLDNKFSKAISQLNEIKDSMEVMVDSDTWGSGDWSVSFRRGVERDIHNINDIISRLRIIKIGD